MHEYKVTLQRPFKADKTTAVIHAHTAADACTQARVHFSGDGDLRVTGVEPTADPGSDDPDRIQFRKDLAAAPPMGTQETERLRKELHHRDEQMKLLCHVVNPGRMGAVSEQEMDNAIARARILHQKDETSSKETDGDGITGYLRTLCAAVNGTPQVGLMHDVFTGALVEVSRLRLLDKELADVCTGYDSLSEKFDAALVVLEMIERGINPDTLLAVNMGKFRELHPKPGP